jgi:hypothetical protein
LKSLTSVAEKGRRGGPTTDLEAIGPPASEAAPAVARQRLCSDSIIQRAETADMSLYAAAARHQLGLALGGDEGARLVEEAAGAMAARGVRVPKRFAAMRVPGRWTTEAADAPSVAARS